MNDDDIITIGKLRRPGKPGAAVTFDPGHGVRVAGESVPRDAEQAARWVRSCGGWLRVLRGAARANEEIARFLKEVRRR